MNYQEFSQKIKSKYPQYQDMDDRQLAQKMVAKYPQYQDVSFDQDQKPSFSNQAMNVVQKMGGPLDVIKEFAPSNVLKQVGVGAANAPGIAGAVINSMPGIGNPGQIPSALQNIQQNPGQGLNAIRRIAAVQGGSPLSPQETVPARMGQGAGIAMEMMAPNLGTGNFKAETPFEAGIKDPTTALPGAFKKAGEAVGKAKEMAGAGIQSPEIDSILTRMENPKAAKGLLTEARRWAMSGKYDETPIAKLLAYKQVLGEAQAEGGRFADVYARAGEKVGQKIKEVAPDLFQSMEKSHLNFVARGNPNSHFPWITTAVNPEVGAAKAFMLPGVQNTMGAAASPILRFPGQIASVVNQALKRQRGNHQ